MKVACIIPAYNEEKTVGSIIKIVKNIDAIHEIIVISDGSFDNTAKISKDLGARTIELDKNLGKGAALKAGIMNTDCDICIFLDADLIGLTENHVMDLLTPVLNNSADMSIGIFSKGRFATDFAQKCAPNLSGQRAIRRDILGNMESFDFARYGVEVTLNKLASKKKLRVADVVLNDITHIMKEEKLGFIRGFAARLRMYWDIIKCLKI